MPRLLLWRTPPHSPAPQYLSGCLRCSAPLWVLLNLSLAALPSSEMATAPSRHFYHATPSPLCLPPPPWGSHIPPSAAADPHLSSFSVHSGPCRPLRPFAFTFPLPLLLSPCLPALPCCLLASRASLRTFQSTGFLKDKGIALSSKVIYGPKGLQFIQFLLFFPLLFAFFCMFLSPFAVCCLFSCHCCCLCSRCCCCCCCCWLWWCWSRWEWDWDWE